MESRILAEGKRQEPQQALRDYFRNKIAIMTKLGQLPGGGTGAENPCSGRIKVKALLVKKGSRSKSKEKPKFYKDVQPIGQNLSLIHI